MIRWEVILTIWVPLLGGMSLLAVNRPRLFLRVEKTFLFPLAALFVSHYLGIILGSVWTIEGLGADIKIDLYKAIFAVSPGAEYYAFNLAFRMVVWFAFFVTYSKLMVTVAKFSVSDRKQQQFSNEDHRQRGNARYSRKNRRFSRRR